MITIPSLYRFEIPSDATIEQGKEGVPIEEKFAPCLNDAELRVSCPVGPVQGGFLLMEDDYHVGQALRAVKELAEQEKRKLRLGNPVEALYFMKQYDRQEEYLYPFLVLGECLGWCYMLWDDRTNKFVPCKLQQGGTMFSCRCRVFIVEDL